MISINKKKCIGCGACVSACGEVFELGPDGKAQIKKNADKKLKCIKEAIEICPVEAIKI